MDYRATLNLPQTDFKMKANLSQREPEYLRKWDEDGLYAKIQTASAGRPLFILHDGPPYANGHIHLGTAFNKVLKDIIIKSRTMAGYRCPYVPGWDCHGLPIEHNVDKELGAKKREIPKLAFREACRTYARKWIDAQRAEFRRLGVLGDWDNPYLTIDYRYEAAIAREFLRFLATGAVTRSKKPVYWCSSCVTALAEAEVEYADHVSPSIYVKFPAGDDLVAAIGLGGHQTFVVIWTTTPWTLPANLAVALHPDYPYAAVAVGDEVWIMAEGLVEAALEKIGAAGEIIARFTAASLEGKTCRHPFMERESLVILAPYVTLDTGTGCVHTAPGHGREDYLSGIKYGLPVLSPVDNQGRFTTEAGPYDGLDARGANDRIMADLAAAGLLAGKAKVSHSYPHCWRCKKPVMFRATEQWFIGMDNNDLRQKAMAAIKKVTWVPKWGMERILGMVESRPDWCLSRQRAWGVPLTVFYCADCGTIANNDAVNARIVSRFEEEGADAWFKHPDSVFLGEGAACGHCGSARFIKEEDILDVWFDSGVSYAAVLEERPALAAPADLYLEGSDQHRGWFQSALLCAVGTRGEPPYKGVLTHGFVVDGQGKKMSKSIGNVIAPEEIIKKYGAEILRLWVASEDYRDDVKISDDILVQLSDAYRKIRNTIRFMLGNLFDFEPQTHRVAYSDMTELDRWALYEYEKVKRKILNGFENYEFHGVFHGVHQFCTVTLSSLYLDILKDRLYTEPTNSRARRSAQTVLHEITEGLLRLTAPILSFTASEAWNYLPADASRPAEVLLSPFPELRDQYLDEELGSTWERILAVRGEMTRILELARQDKMIGHSLEAEVQLHAEGELKTFLVNQWNLLRTVAIVSSMRLTDFMEGGTLCETFPGLSILVRAATGEKCERCWTRSETVGADSDHPTVCSRCLSVVRGIAA